MPKLLSISILIFFLATIKVNSQTLFWSDNFETTPTASPSSGTRTPEENGGVGGPPNTSYFRLTDGSNVSQNVSFTGKEGTNYWAGEDHNAPGTGFTASGAQGIGTNDPLNELSITWTNINIAGKNNLNFKGLLAANSTSQAWDNRNICNGIVTTSNTDYIIVQYRIDTGPWTDMLRFFSKGQGDKDLYLETTGDECGDGAKLTNVFSEFSANISGTGNVLSLRLNVYSEGENEEWGVDNFRLFSTESCTPPTVSVNPSNKSACTGTNSNTFNISASGATAYQWQVDQTGSGTYTNLSNGGYYSNVTTNTLTVSNAVISMNGYRYRCVAYNGSTTCLTNSTYGTLSVFNTPAAPTASSNTPVCTGNPINLSASTIPGTTYSWSGPNSFTSSAQNPSTANATAAMAGTYSVTATVNGCVSPQGTTSVVVNTTPAAPTASSNTPVCTGNPINLSASTIPGTTYSWSGPNSFTSSAQNPSTANATAAMAGTYSVTATANGCTSAQGTTSVVVNTTPAAPTASSNTPVCTGNPINLSASTIAGATYSWSGPNSFTSSAQNPSIANATAAMAGTYSVTATVNGCTSAQGTTSVVVNTTPVAPTASSNTPVCTGNTINLSASTIAGATYSWNGPNSFTAAIQNPSIANATTAMAGTYSVTATVNGCTSAQGTTSVVVNTTPVAPTASSNTPVCTGNTINLSASTIAGATYSWSGPNSFTSSAQNPSIANATAAMAGTYSVTATVNGCTSAQGTTSVVVNTTPAAPTASSNTPVCTGNTINLSASTIAGATYSWSGPNSFTSSAQNPSIANATTAMAGTYSVTATVNGCTSAQGTTSVVVNTTPAAPTASSNTPVCTGNPINLSASTIPGATYSWSGPNSFTSSAQNPSTANATAAMAGTYSVTATANGCTSAQGTTSVVVNTTPAAPTASSNTPVCTGNPINLSASTIPGATYSWNGPNSFTSSAQNPSIANATAGMAGTYTVNVTVSGCVSASSSTSVVVNTSPSAPSVSSNSPICSGNTINLTATTIAGATYSWSGPNSFTSSAQNPSLPNATTAMAGTYTLNVSLNGCTSTNVTTTVSVSSPIIANITKTDVSCFAGSNGTIELTVSGGTPGYSFSWADGPTVEDRTGLSAGTYSVSISDANNCTGSASTTITVPSAISFTSASSNNASCFNGNNGTASVNPASGGAGGFTYDWTPGNPTGDGTTSVSNLSPGTYTATATDINGCTATQSFTITAPAALAIVPSHVDVLCHGASTGSAQVSVTGGMGAYTYSWSPTAGSTESLTGLAAGTYSVTVKDANLCEAVETIIISEPTALQITATQVDILCNGTATGSATASVSGGTGAYTYLWTPGNSNTPSISGLAAGTYTVLIKDVNLCEASHVYSISQPAALTVTPSQTNVICNGSSTGTATVNVSGGTGAYTYIWQPNVSSSSTASNLAAGNYLVVIKDANLCEATQSFTISQSGPASHSISQSACGSYTLNGQTYTSTGTYTQSFFNNNGCDSILTLNLTITQASYSSLSATSCDNYTLNGTTYTQSGTYTQTLVNAARCDSILTLDLIINNSSSYTLTTSTCESYTLNGHTYTSSGTYQQVLTNQVGCDWNFTLVLTILNPSYSTITEEACESYTLNGQVYTASGTYTQTYTNAIGCDSIITLNLTIKQPLQTVITEVSCGAYTLNNQTYVQSGVFTQNLQSSTGCDSTITLHLTIENVNTAVTQDGPTLSANLSGVDYQWINCNGNTLITGENGQTFTALTNGDYAVVITDANCSDTSLCMTVSNVGITENTSGELTIYPSPNDGNFTVELGETYPMIHASVYSMDGKLIKQRKYVNTNRIYMEINTASGIYFIRVNTGNKTSMQRFIIK